MILLKNKKVKKLIKKSSLITLVTLLTFGLTFNCTMAQQDLSNSDQVVSVSDSNTNTNTSKTNSNINSNTNTNSTTTDTDSQKTYRTIVKLNNKTTIQAEASVSINNLEIKKNSSKKMGDLFSKYKINKMEPVYEGLVKWKKKTGKKEKDFVLKVQSDLLEMTDSGSNSEKAVAPEASDLSNTYVIESSLKSEKDYDSLLKELKKDTRFEYVEPDKKLTAVMIPDDPYFGGRGAWGQSFDDLYGLKKISCPEAWNMSEGNGITVAVVDTGIDNTHPDISSNLWINSDEIAGNGIDDDNNGFIDDTYGWNFAYGNNNIVDDHGHGTHVAGTIAAVGNNGVGVIGVAPEAKVMAVKALAKDGIGYTSLLAQAILYAASNGAKVINCSFGGYGATQTMKEAIDFANSMGVVVVAAAGNDNLDAQDFEPACHDKVITVAATDNQDVKAYFSNWGSKIDVAAPGVDILSLRAAGTSLGKPIGDRYAIASGTSMAAPHVSGAVALILSQHPGFSSKQVKAVLRSSATDVMSAGFDYATGYGRINSLKSLQMNDTLESNITGPSSKSNVTGKVTITGSANGNNFSGYTLEYGKIRESGEQPTEWNTITEATTPVTNGQLGVFDTTKLTDGTYAIRLGVKDNSAPQNIYFDRIELVIDLVKLSSPAEVTDPSKAAEVKPGTVMPIKGSAQGQSFQKYRLEWAEGLNPTEWFATGFTLENGGNTPVTDGLLANWDSSVCVGKSGYYQLRLLVDNDGFTNETRTIIKYVPVSISSPEKALDPSYATQIKPGKVVPIKGTAKGQTFQRYRLEWAEGLNPTQWFTTGFTLENGGNTPVMEGLLANWDSSVYLGKAEYYQIRLLVDNGGFTEEARTIVYLEPDLVSVNWPQKLDMAIPKYSGTLPAYNGAGQDSLVGIGSIQLYKAKFMKYSCDGVLQNASPFDYTPNGQSAVGDIDEFPGEETVFVKDGKMRILKSDNSYREFPLNIYYNFANDPVVLQDLDLDSVPEILTVGSDFDNKTRYLYAFKSDGSLLSSKFPIPISDEILVSRNDTSTYLHFLAMDINNDGEKEIITQQNNENEESSLNLYKWDGTPLTWKAEQPRFAKSYIKRMMGADLEHDGQGEIILFAGLNGISDQQKIYVIASDGSIKKGWPHDLPDYGPSKYDFAVADMDRDGNDEIVYTQFNGMNILKFDGTPLSSAWPPRRYFYLHRFSLGDINNDNYPEILVFSQDFDKVYTPYDGSAERKYQEYELRAIDRNAQTIRKWRVLGPGGGSASYTDSDPVLGDFDKNGKVDIAIHCNFGNKTGGGLTVLTTDGDYNANNMDWPVMHNDPQNTSVHMAAKPLPDVASISLDKTSVSIMAGQTVQLSATIRPIKDTNKNVTWSVQNQSASNVATVSETGLVTANNEGTAVIRVTSNVDSSKYAECTITVTKLVVPVTGVSLSKTSTSLTEGQAEQLSAAVAPQNATNKNVTWSVNSQSTSNVATVSETGLVTANNAGTAVIRVTSVADSSKYAECTITVTKPVVPVTGVSLDKTSTSLTVVQTEQLSATVAPENATNKNVTWSVHNQSTNNVATVSATGLVTANNAGTATIRATSNEDPSKYAECTVTVTVAASGILLSEGFESSGGSIPAGWAVQDVNGTTGKWSFVTSGGSPNPGGPKAGTYMARFNSYDAAKGQSTRLCRTSGINLTDNVTYSLDFWMYHDRYNSGDKDNIQVQVSVDGGSTWLDTGDSINRYSNVEGWKKHTINLASFKSTVDLRIAFLANSQYGMNMYIDEVSVNGPSEGIPVTAVTLNKTSASISKGQTEQLSAAVAPENATNKNVTWSVYSQSASNVATVSATGLVTASNAGTAVIRATSEADPSKYAECTVTVTQPVVPVTGVSLNKTLASISKGQTEQLSAAVAPENATNKNVTWSVYSQSASNVATVSETGFVTANNAGTAVIRATSSADSSKYAECTITVTANGILLNEGFEGSGGNVPTGWAVQDVNGTAGEWSFVTNGSGPNPGGAKAGVYMAKFNSYDAAKGLSTRLYSTSGINLTNSLTYSLDFWMYHDRYNSADKDNMQVQVSVDGGSTWVNTGDAINRYEPVEGWKKHTISLNSFKGTADLRIAFLANSQYGMNMYIDEVSVNGSSEEIPVTVVNLNKTSASLIAGQTEQLSAVVIPENATNKNVTWSVSNQTASNVATVSATGLVTASNAGTAVIRATSDADSSKYAECTVAVTAAAAPVTAVSLNKTSLSMTAGQTEQLSATAMPENAANKSLMWYVYGQSASNVIEVSARGIVTAKNPGTAIIRVSSQADSSKYAECTVTVSAAAVPVTAVSLNKTSASITAGQTEQLSAVVIPENATNKNVTWSVSNQTASNVATVSSTGLVTASNAGTAVIRATSDADSSKYAECTVTVTAAAAPVTAVSLNKTSLSMTAGQTEQLSTTVMPENTANKSLMWYVYGQSASNVIEVSAKGVVTAKNPGTAIIRVSSQADSSKYAECTVTVVAPQPATGILFSEGFENTNGSVPAGWAVIDVNGTDGDWKFVSSGTYPNPGGPKAGAYMAQFNSLIVANGQSTRLYRTLGIKPENNVTYSLDFWMYHDSDNSKTDNIQVQVSTDGGSTWVNAGEAINRYNTEPGWKKHTISLDSFNSTADLRIAFLAVGQFGRNMYLDEISVTGSVAAQ